MFKIYLSGAMQDATVEEQTETRKSICNEFMEYSEVSIFNPYVYFNYQHDYHQSEKEVFMYELDNVRNSDLVIYHEQGIKSIGSSMELAVAYENRIPVLILNKDEHKLHPWIEEISRRTFTNVDELVSYIKWYYLN